MVERQGVKRQGESTAISSGTSCGEPGKPSMDNSRYRGSLSADRRFMSWKRESQPIVQRTRRLPEE